MSDFHSGSVEPTAHPRSGAGEAGTSLLGGSVEPTPPEPFAFPVLESDGPVVTIGTPVARADEVLREAQVAAKRIAAQAEADGHERGYALGLEEGGAAVVAARQALEEVVGGVLELRSQFLEQGEARAVELALLLAEKIVGAALDVQPGRVLEVVRGALRRTVERDHLVIEVHPADLEIVRAEVGEVAARLGGVGQLEVVAEQRVARGGCVVRTAEGEIDSRIETQLERARELLREALAAGPA
jgi:flagellar assembly protein FliH